MSFRTKKDATTYYRAILYGYELGHDVSAADNCSLLELLRWHPDWTAKWGGGVVWFYVDRPPGEKRRMDARCFWFRRADGSRCDFSFLKCIKNMATGCSWAMRGETRPAQGEGI